MVEILVNGERKDIGDGLTLGGLLAILEIPADRVAIELDKRIISRCDWEATLLTDGAQLEIVQFVGGG